MLNTDAMHYEIHFFVPCSIIEVSNIPSGLGTTCNYYRSMGQCQAILVKLQSTKIRLCINEDQKIMRIMCIEAINQRSIAAKYGEDGNGLKLEKTGHFFKFGDDIFRKSTNIKCE